MFIAYETNSSAVKLFSANTPFSVNTPSRSLDMSSLSAARQRNHSVSQYPIALEALQH